MAEPLPPLEHAAAAVALADEAIAALKRTKPNNAAQARARSAELMTLQQTLLEASRKVVAANAQKRIASSNGHASAADPFSEEVLRALASALVPFIKEVVAEAVAKCLTDGGTWKPEKQFSPNQLATYRGAIWVCLKANSDVRPGTNDAWRLMHKTV